MGDQLHDHAGHAPEPKQPRPLELAAVVGALKKELEETQRQRRDGDLRFHIVGVELELTVEVERNRDGRGGVKFYVIEAGGSIRSTDRTVQRIKLTLVPVGDQTISDQGEGQ